MVVISYVMGPIQLFEPIEASCASICSLESEKYILIGHYDIRFSEQLGALLHGEALHFGLLDVLAVPNIIDLQATKILLDKECEG